MPEGVAAGDTAEGTASARAAEDRAAEDAVVDAWRGLLVAHSRLVPAVEADLRATGQVPLSWYDVLLERLERGIHVVRRGRRGDRGAG